MYSFVSTGALNGIESYLATVEVDASTGLPGFEMVGMLNAEIKDVTMVRLIQSIIKKSA